MNLVWFRNDLRTVDNPALWNAAQEGPVMGYFQVTPRQWQAHDMAPCRVDFILRTLVQLRKNLNKRGIPLIVETVPDFAAAPAALDKIVKKYRCNSVFWNNEYPVDELKRDKAVEDRLGQAGIPIRRFHDRVIAPPGSVLTGAGEPYKVFTPFKRAWLQLLQTDGPELLPVPGKQSCLDNSDEKSIPASLKGFKNSISAKFLTKAWPAGEQEAVKRLKRFTEEAMADYQAKRDIPGEPGTSQLSPYLAVGAISPGQCLKAALFVANGDVHSGNPGAVTWLSELIWREFYQHILVAFPQVCRHKPFKRQTDAVRWRQAPANFQRWCEGKTGVPIVDAGMRELLQTGWMHNRVRMIVAMFLSKNLLIDWRLGEQFFMRHLIDGDLAANNGGWQWSASTGTDAVPYFRVFNPFSQASRFDPDGLYIRRYVPELRALPPEILHHPKKLAAHRPANYPELMVDLKASRQRAIDAFASLS